jgi:LPS-assembly lipoprotein
MIWRYSGIVGVCLVLVGVAPGCGGFHPLYGTTVDSSPVASALAAVAIPEPETRLGQIIRNDLLSSMRPAGTAEPDRYSLAMTIQAQEEKTIESATIDRVLRRTIRLNVSFALTEHGTDRIVYRGKTFSQASYDEVGQSFADLQAKTDAAERAAHEVSLDIRTRLAAHFSAS